MNDWQSGLAEYIPEITSILPWRDPACQLASDAAAQLHASQPILGRVVSALITEACHTQAVQPHRMLSLFVAGAISGSPVTAVPATAVSIVTWAGYEAIDDAVDGEKSDTATLLGGIVAATLLPEFVLERAGLSEAERDGYRRAIIDATLHAGEGEALAASQSIGLPDWISVTRIYAAKTGAMYARDAMLAARSCGAGAAEQRHWYVFGQMYGLLYQANNDNAGCPAQDNADLRNATPTLLLATAADSSSGTPCSRAELLHLHTAARSDVPSRLRLAALLRDEDVLLRYAHRLDRLVSDEIALLHQMASPSPYREALEALVEQALRGALGVRT